MCVIGIAYQASRRYPLIVAANRDERHARPSAPATWWLDRPGILSGRDLVAGGTWLGVSTAGRFAAVTNVFDGAPASGALSRGALVGNFLASNVAAAAYARTVASDDARYRPYNLLLLDATGLRFTSNRREAAALAPGIHACSNDMPGEDWPKVRLLGAALRDAIDGPDPAAAPSGGDQAAVARSVVTSAPGAGQLADRLLDLLAGPAARGERATAPESLFIVGREFGTRCSTVLIIDDAGGALFIERSFDATGSAAGEHRFTFQVPAFASRAR